MDLLQKRQRGSRGKGNEFYAPTVIFDTDVSPQAKMIYLYLCSLGDLSKRDFPSYSDICVNCSIKSVSAVERAIKELVEAELLDKDLRVIAKY